MQIPLSVLLAPLAAQAVNIVLSNDDGWAEKNIRVFYDTLTSAGESVIISAPADNRSGTGSSDATPGTVTSGCEFNSCPAGSPPYGSDGSNPRFNYVNSYPVTAIRYGIQTLSPKFFGANLGSTTLISGTVGAAAEAALEGIPAIAFSGTSGSQVSYTTATQTYQTVYAQLSTNVTTTLVDSGKPYLPDGIWLNVNYPTVSSSTCTSASRFNFVLSRINSASSSTAADVRTCGSTRLPTESTVVGTSGCYASISVGVASNKKDAAAAQQDVVLQKLQSILSCLP
ncbi:hypothetical protein INS49_007751 [Diaporthe citri]|uniref:uncharacterized protein n=1 Tax=Diaporthe citri TaxID=83186 RepID=UPI001C7EE7D0|nr:uncharacterized protein INS49_007751 [Diaporthe citri]KAG6362659.1 hypothetical protein INS49_007751 [Diaporthe citri]